MSEDKGVSASADRATQDDAAFVIRPITETYLRGIVRDLARVRQWIEGFEAAGKRGPAHSECLRRAQMLLGDALATRDAPNGGQP